LYSLLSRRTWFMCKSDGLVAARLDHFILQCETCA
jgi:hypothetical protein